ncbi:MAG: hypothetical protein PGN33_14160 [Methylobacterium radiotolerans]
MTKKRILLSPGYHAEAGETEGHQHDVYTTVPPLGGNQRIHVGTLMKSAVEAWANAYNGAYLDNEAANFDGMAEASARISSKHLAIGDETTAAYWRGRARGLQLAAQNLHILPDLPPTAEELAELRAKPDPA